MLFYPWHIVHQNTEKGTVAFAAKGGHNDEPHNHNDVGNFIFHVNGESLLADTGAGEYTKQYFGPERYSYLCNSSRGHSVPIINGNYQSSGKEHSAKILNQATTENSEIFVMDIAKAYSEEGLISLTRAFTFKKTPQPELILNDSYIFSNKPKAITERFVSFSAPTLLQPGKVQISGEKGSVIINYDQDLLAFSVEKDIFINHVAQREDIYFLDFNVKVQEREFSLNFSFELDN